MNMRITNLARWIGVVVVPFMILVMPGDARAHCDTLDGPVVKAAQQGAGEGSPFTGLKPAGTDLGPAVPASDKALESGSIDIVAKMLTEDVRHGLEEQFKNVMAKKNFNKDDVAAGQRYVGAYVEYIHYVERIFEASTTPAHRHYPEPVSTNEHSDK